MLKIQNLNSLPIGIHPPRTADKSQGPRPTGEEVGSCVPDFLQLRHVHIGETGKESPRDPHKGAQSCHQTRRDREVGHSRARSGRTTSNAVAGGEKLLPHPPSGRP